MKNNLEDTGGSKVCKFKDIFKAVNVMKAQKTIKENAWEASLLKKKKEIDEVKG